MRHETNMSSFPFSEGPGSRTPRWIPYTIAILGTAAMLLVHLGLQGSQREHPSLILFMFPIVASSYLGGLWPGLTASAMAALAAAFLFSQSAAPFMTRDSLDLARGLILIAIGPLVSVLGERLHAAQRRAQASQRMHAGTLASIQDAVVATDGEGRVTFVNAAAEGLTGFLGSEAEGRNVSGLLQLEGDSPNRVLVRRDGRRVPVSENCAPLVAPGRGVAGRVLVLRDKTGQQQVEATLRAELADRKRAEQTSEEAQQRLAAVIESALLGIVTVDEEDRVTLFNPAAETIFGCRAAAMLGQPVERIITDWASVLRRGAAAGPARGRTCAGAHLPLEISISRSRVSGREQSTVFVRDLGPSERAEERFTRVFRASPIALYLSAVTDASILDANDAFLTLSGYRREQVLGRTASSLGLLDPAALARFRGRLAEGDTLRDEDVIINDVGGGQRVCTVSVERLELEQGPYYLVMLFDITARKHAEDELRRAEERFAKAFRASPAGQAIFTLEDGRVVEANDTLLALLGRSREEVVGHTTSEIRLLQDLDHRELGRRLRAGGPLRELATQVRAPSGAEREILLSLEPIELQGAAHALAIVVDVTERRRTEEALRTSEERFRQLAETIGEVFWLTDLEKRSMIYVSPAYEAIWGRSCASLYERPLDWLEAVHPEDRDRLLVAATTKQEAGAYDEEYRIIRPDGSERWIRDQAFPVRDASGQIVRIAGTAADITERRRLEAQLRQTQRLESVGLLAGGVAHDFNNILTAISGCGESLAEVVGDDPLGHEITDEISEAVGRGASLTRQLLAFSRQQVIEPRVTDLNVVVKDTEKMLRRLLGEDVLLATVLPAAISRVKIDQGQIVQVLMNMAVNARDAMPKGGRLSITTRDVVAPDPAHAGAYVVLEISDTGCGMSPEVQARVFEPFFTTKGISRGTGLGLAVSHGIIQQSGGWIEVCSRVGEGTCFAIYLPAVDEPLSAAGDGLPGGPLGGNETILLVEDEDAVRRVAVRALTAQGYAVLQATDGVDAMRVVARHGGPVDLLVTDVVMPRMDGRELAEALARADIPVQVLYTSGYTDDSVVRHGVLASEVAFLQKPYTPRLLLRSVRQVLDSARNAAA